MNRNLLTAALLLASGATTAADLPLSINVGTSPNDKTGDSIRASFIKTMAAVNALNGARNQLNGIAGLDGTGKLLSNQVPGFVRSNGDVRTPEGVLLGRYLDSKLILQPETVQIQGAGSTGDASGFKALTPGTTNPLPLGELSVAPQIKAFGSPNGADWSAAFAAAEASNASRIVLPSGTYNTGRLSFQLNKAYAGPGSAAMVDSNGSFYPADYSYILQRPFGGTGVSINRYFSADGRYSDRDFRVIHPGLRVGLDEPYFAPEFSKQLSVYVNRGGHSGQDALVTSAVPAGSTTIPLNATEGLSQGTKVAFLTFADPFNLTDRVTITNVTPTSITVTPPTSLPHVVGDIVTQGFRTMQSRGHYELNHGGGGDAYINLFRVTGTYTPTAGQDHVFNGSTAGIDGGDITASTNGQYFTGREVSMTDTNHDVAYVAEVRSFVRDNNVGARGAFWGGNFYQSTGSKPVDFGYALAGKWGVGFDTSRADLSSSGNIVVNMAEGQGLTWGSLPNTAEKYPHMGKLFGKTWAGTEAGEWKLKRPNNGTQVDAIAVTDSGGVRQPQKPMVVAEASSQIVLTGAFTPLALPSKYDATGNYTAATGRFVCPVVGRYRIHLRAQMAAGTAAQTGVRLSVFKNGAIAISGDGTLAQAFNPLAAASAETILPCNVGEFFEVRGADAGNTGGVLHGGPAVAFTIEYLG